MWINLKEKQQKQIQIDIVAVVCSENYNDLSGLRFDN
jgi:hypothetical protein